MCGACDATDSQPLHWTQRSQTLFSALLATSQDTLGFTDHSMSTLGLSTTQLALFLPRPRKVAVATTTCKEPTHRKRPDSSEKTLMLGTIDSKTRRGVTEDEMVGWHHRLKGHESEQTLGDSEGQGSLACCSPWGRKELDTTEQLNSNNYISPPSERLPRRQRCPKTSV